jgi:ribosome-binding protein aMBF1 (putative translation factor)
MDKDFVEWMTEEADKRGWDDAELSRRAGVHPSTISTIRSREKRCGVKTAKGLARAFGFTQAYVFHLAGIEDVKPTTEENPTLTQINEVLRDLPADEQLGVLYIVLGIREKVDKLRKSRGQLVGNTE